MNTSHSGLIYHACTSTPVYQSAHEISSTQLHRFHRYDWGKIKKNGSFDPDHAPVRGGSSSKKLRFDTDYPCANLTILPLAVPEI